MLTVNELYVYELIKFVCKSVNNLSTTVFYFFMNSIPVKNVLVVLDCSLLQFHPAVHAPFFCSGRDSKHWNFLSRKGLIPRKFGAMKDGEVTDFVHRFRDLHILPNIDLVKFVFNGKNMTILMADACRWLPRWPPGAKSKK